MLHAGFSLQVSHTPDYREIPGFIPEWFNKPDKR
jgi:hypothetical protein